MRNIKLKELSFALVVTLVLIETQSSLALSDDRSELLTKIRIQRTAIKRAGDQLNSVEKGIAEADKTLNVIKKTLDETGDPELVLDDLAKADRILKRIESTINFISTQTASIEAVLKTIAEIVRESGLTKLETELKEAFTLLDETNKRLRSDEEKAESVRKAFGQVADKISLALTAVGRSNLKSVDETGVDAKIVFVEDGTTLMVIGTATGLDPAETYFSNIYDIGSASEGPGACVPSIFDPKDPDFILPTMFLGFWEVDADGNGRLCAINTNDGADFVPLDKIGTVSVRLIVGPPPAPDAPPMNELVACGSVNSRPRP
ncbi:MAG: hypothetical protein MI923_24200 [Phycisphaerales bacterium]|nr:hypothetical protein [Phycisphaerales bacterium]